MNSSSTELSQLLTRTPSNELFLNWTLSTSDSNSLKWTLLQLNSLNFWQELPQMNSSSTELSQLLTRTNLLPWNFPLYSLGADPTENAIFYCPVLFQACLLIRCLAIDVLLLRVLAPAGMCLPSCYLAMGLYATICSNVSEEPATPVFRSCNLKMTAADPSETSVPICKVTWHHSPEVRKYLQIKQRTSYILFEMCT
jgi:hypothetical protein